MLKMELFVEVVGNQILWIKYINIKPRKQNAKHKNRI